MKTKRDFAKTTAIGFSIFAGCMAVVGCVAMFLIVVEEKDTRQAADAILAERCVVTPDGRTLKTVSSDTYPRYAEPARVGVDKVSGKEFIAGDIFTIDGRRVEMFHTSRIKLVKCG